MFPIILMETVLAVRPPATCSVRWSELFRGGGHCWNRSGGVDVQMGRSNVISTHPFDFRHRRINAQKSPHGDD